MIEFHSILFADDIVFNDKNLNDINYKLQQ